jgi:hypothetical protein
MTMHLEGPWLSTTGKKKGKFKWISAQAKRQHEELEQSWKNLKAKYQIEKEEKKKQQGLKSPTLVYSLKPPPGRSTTANLKSVDSGVGNAVKKTAPVYTGDKIVGIGTMHKSNAVPIFSDSQAKEISSMRR